MIAAGPNYSRNKEQKHDEEEKQEKIRNQRLRFFGLVTVVTRVARSLVFAARCFEDRIDSVGEAAFIILVSKAWLDPVLSNVECSDVGERAFQTVTDLNEHLPVLSEHEQHNAVPIVLLTDAPRLGNALRVCSNVIVALHFWKYRDHNLV